MDFTRKFQASPKYKSRSNIWNNFNHSLVVLKYHNLIIMTSKQFILLRLGQALNVHIKSISTHSGGGLKFLQRDDDQSCLLSRLAHKVSKWFLLYLPRQSKENGESSKCENLHEVICAVNESKFQNTAF